MGGWDLISRISLFHPIPFDGWPPFRTQKCPPPPTPSKQRSYTHRPLHFARFFWLRPDGLKPTLLPMTSVSSSSPLHLPRTTTGRSPWMRRDPTHHHHRHHHHHLSLDFTTHRELRPKASCRHGRAERNSRPSRSSALPPCRRRTVSQPKSRAQLLMPCDGRHGIFLMEEVS